MVVVSMSASACSPPSAVQISGHEKETLEPDTENPQTE